MPEEPRGAVPAPRRRLLDWKAVLGILISAAALYYTFRNQELGDVMATLAEADLLLMTLAAAAVTGVFWIRAWRWRTILRPIRDTPFRSRFSSVTIGFMGNNLLPARIGEFMRAYALSRQEPVPVVASFASLVIERLFDGVLVVALLFVAMALPGFPSFDAAESIPVMGIDGGIRLATLARGAATIVFIGILVLIALVLMPRQAVRVLEQVVRILPLSLRRPIIDALEAFLSGVSVLRDPVLLLQTSAWSVFLWVFNAVGCWIAFKAFGFDLPFVAAIFFQSAIALAVSVPSGPGFIGVYHAMATFVLSRLFDETAVNAQAFAVGFHLAGFIPVTLIGLWYAWRLGLSMREVTASEEIVEQAVERKSGVDPKNP